MKEQEIFNRDMKQVKQNQINIENKVSYTEDTCDRVQDVDKVWKELLLKCKKVSRN